MPAQSAIATLERVRNALALAELTGDAGGALEVIRAAFIDAGISLYTPLLPPKDPTPDAT